eukprot:5515669-Amphidinium_carterae.1
MHSFGRLLTSTAMKLSGCQTGAHAVHEVGMGLMQCKYWILYAYRYHVPVAMQDVWVGLTQRLYWIHLAFHYHVTVLMQDVWAGLLQCRY